MDALDIIEEVLKEVTNLPYHRVRNSAMGAIVFICTKCGRALVSMDKNFNANSTLHMADFSGTMYNPGFYDALKKTITDLVGWHSECTQYCEFLRQVEQKPCKRHGINYKYRFKCW